MANLRSRLFSCGWLVLQARNGSHDGHHGRDMVHIIWIELLDINFLRLLPKIDTVRVDGRLGLCVGQAGNQPCRCCRCRDRRTRAQTVLSLLLQLLLLDELNLADVVFHIFEALSFQCSHERLVRLQLLKEEILVDGIELALLAETGQRSDMCI